MKSQLRRAAVLLLAVLPPAGGAAEMKDVLTVEVSKPAAYRTRFGMYGHMPQSHIGTEQFAGLRFRLPGGVPEITQTGIYSYFELSGDCEVILTYELLNVAPPRGGYGSGLGLAFDAGEGVGRGAIQRFLRAGEGEGYLLQAVPEGSRGEVTALERFVLATAKRGRMGLRREGKELVFLAADGPNAALEEVDRVPFSTGTIRAVRVFADTGGSPTALDVRVRDLQVRAEQIAAGAPPRQGTSVWSRVGAVLGAVAGVGLLGWGWHICRRRSDDEAASPPKRRRLIKRA